MNAGGTDAPFGPALAEMLKARCAGRCTLAEMPDTRYERCCRRHGSGRILRMNAGVRMPPSALPSRKCSKPAPPDAFNTEDVAGDMAADESYESGE